YGPATEADLAKWSGLPLGTCRRALEAAQPLESAGDLHALPGTLDFDPPEPPPASLLAAFDTSMLGWASRQPLVRPGADHEGVPPRGRHTARPPPRKGPRGRPGAPRGGGGDAPPRPGSLRGGPREGPPRPRGRGRGPPAGRRDRAPRLGPATSPPRLPRPMS